MAADLRETIKRVPAWDASQVEWVVSMQNTCDCGGVVTRLFHPLTGVRINGICRACAEDVVRRSVASAYDKKDASVEDWIGNGPERKVVPFGLRPAPKAAVAAKPVAKKGRKKTGVAR